MSTVESLASSCGSSRGSSTRSTPLKNGNGAQRMCSGCHDLKSRECFPKRQWEKKSRRCYSCFANTVPFSSQPPKRQDHLLDGRYLAFGEAINDTGTTLPTTGHITTNQTTPIQPSELLQSENKDKWGLHEKEDVFQGKPASNAQGNKNETSVVLIERPKGLSTDVKKIVQGMSPLSNGSHSTLQQEWTTNDPPHDGETSEDDIAEPAATLDEDIGNLARRWTPQVVLEGTDAPEVLDPETISAEFSETINSQSNWRDSCRDCLFLLASPFLDDIGSVTSVVPGMFTLFLIGSLIGVASNKNTSLPTPWYQYTSAMIGYVYFICWSISFYPQVLSNYKRKSTRGLSADFCVLNVVGFACYTAYNVSMFWSPVIREHYRHKYGSEPTVQSNDVAFAIHALLLSSITLAQIVCYRGSERPSKIILAVIVLILVFCAGYPVLVFYEIFSWLDYIYALSFVKIGISLIKYIPQVMLNYQRKSTVGWSIWNILLDFTGGVLSDTQLVLDCADMHDFSGITGNLAKFGLGFVSILFDIIFMVQHYVLYSDARHEQGEPGRAETEPLLSEHERQTENGHNIV